MRKPVLRKKKEVEEKVEEVKEEVKEVKTKKRVGKKAKEEAPVTPVKRGRGRVKGMRLQAHEDDIEMVNEAIKMFQKKVLDLQAILEKFITKGNKIAIKNGRSISQDIAKMAMKFRKQLQEAKSRIETVSIS